MRIHYEADRETFNAEAYRITRAGVAWHVLGWETEPDEDTEWTGLEARTGRVVAVMIGDDHRETFDPDEITPIPREDYCTECGQLGCCNDGLEREGA